VVQTSILSADFQKLPLSFRTQRIKEHLKLLRDNRDYMQKADLNDTVVEAVSGISLIAIIIISLTV